MQRPLLAGFASLAVALPMLAAAHDTFTSMYALAGYVQDVELRVTQGCDGGSRVNRVRVKMPSAVMQVSVENRRDWTVEVRTRRLDSPVAIGNGHVLKEAVDEIIWSNPTSPVPASRIYEGFRFRVVLPDAPGTILFFKAINGCEKGEDRFVDLPKEALDPTQAGFAAKLWHFMTSSKGPAPFLVLEKPARPQYPWGDAGKAAGAAPAAAAAPAKGAAPR